MLVPPPNTAEVAGGAGHVVWVQRAQVLDRVGGRTRPLPLDAHLHDLDVGTDARGRPVAVYVRCRPGCDVYAFDLTTGRERLVRSVSARGASERQPTVAAGRVAARRGVRVVLGSLTGARRARVLLSRNFDELELGPKQLAYTTYSYTGVGNGSLDLVLYGLRSHRRTLVERRYIGEGDSTGIGALRLDGPTLWWQETARSGCHVGGGADWRYDLRRRRRTPTDAAPVDVRRALVVPPDTPESEGCS